jgi:hypothetical protein
MRVFLFLRANFFNCKQPICMSMMILKTLQGLFTPTLEYVRISRTSLDLANVSNTAGPIYTNTGKF